MRRPLVLLALCFITLALAGGSAATIKPGRGMSGVELGMTAAQVQAKAGRPVGKAPGRWHYPRFWVRFRNRRVVETTTTRSHERLANGLGVRSTERQVRATYPQVECDALGIASFRRCRLGNGEPGSRVTDFLINSGVVLQITIQQL